MSKPVSMAWLTSQGFVNLWSGSYYWYWSSTASSYSAHPGSRAIIDLNYAELLAKGSYYSCFVWPVRAGQQNDPDHDYPANIYKTGQTTSYYPGDDGDLQWGVRGPSRRFINHGDGTVTDTLTGLMWLKDAFCFGISFWTDAHDLVADFNINPGSYPCADYNATYSDWRLPNRRELLSLSHREPTAGVAIVPDHPFENLFHGYSHLLTSNSYFHPPTYWQHAWYVGPYFSLQLLTTYYNQSASAWPVRGGIHGSPMRDADFDGDGDVDGSDLAVFADAYADGDLLADLNGDHNVDTEDLAIFAENYGT